MAHGDEIRELIGSLQDFDMLQGHVEMDETYVGGHRPGKRGRGAAGKTIVMGMKERDGDIRTAIIPNVKKSTLRDVTLRNVEPGSVVSTDELMSYGLLEGDGYVHGSVPHGEKIWSSYDYRTGETHSVNHVESFWKLFKVSVRSTHIHVSAKYMDRYLAEFFPVEPPRDAERDVRSDCCSCLMTLEAAFRKAASSIGPMPAASCWRMNSSKRFSRNASASEIMPPAFASVR